MKKGLAAISALLIILLVVGLVFVSLSEAKKPATPGGGKGRAKKQCNDNIDNDGDDLIDYPEDPGCDSKRDNDEYNAPPTECNDGINNDYDNYIDYPEDPGCDSALDTTETSAIACDNGINDDYDNYIDYPTDTGCYGSTDTTETSYVHCDNGIDDDSDSDIDYPTDSGCTSTTDQTESPNTCTDTDGGWIYDVFGYTYGDWNDQPYNNSDYCITSDLLMEWYCSGGETYMYNVSCSASNFTACASGACY